MDHAAMAQPVSTAVDSLSTALKGNIVPSQEYLLQGSVLDSAVEILLHRLRGLCDNVDSGPETFHDHEMCFSIRGGTSPQPLLSLRVRRALDCQDMPWQLRYIGTPEMGTGDNKSRPTIVRNSIDIGTSATIVEFLTELGCRMDFEYIVRGYMFCKGRMKITVSKIFKFLEGDKFNMFLRFVSCLRLNKLFIGLYKISYYEEACPVNQMAVFKISSRIPADEENCHDVDGREAIEMGQGKPPESVEPISQSYLVELSVLAPSGQDAIAEDMRCFAEQLRPLVQLEKVDYKRLPVPMGP